MILREPISRIRNTYSCNVDFGKGTVSKQDILKELKQIVIAIVTEANLSEIEKESIYKELFNLTYVGQVERAFVSDKKGTVSGTWLIDPVYGVAEDQLRFHVCIVTTAVDEFKFSIMKDVNHTYYNNLVHFKDSEPFLQFLSVVFTSINVLTAEAGITDLSKLDKDSLELALLKIVDNKIDSFSSTWMNGKQKVKLFIGTIDGPVKTTSSMVPIMIRLDVTYTEFKTITSKTDSSWK